MIVANENGRGHPTTKTSYGQKRKPFLVTTGVVFICYEERLRSLKLATLEFRRLRTDLILLYKHTHKLIKLDTNTYCPICKHNTNMLQPSLAKTLRGHNKKYQVHHHTGVRDRFFTSRVLNIWNKLKTETVNATSTNAFKSRLLTDTNLPADMFTTFKPKICQF